MTRLAYRVREVAAMLGLSEGEVRALLDRGALERLPTGSRALRITAASVERLARPTASRPVAWREGDRLIIDLQQLGLASSSWIGGPPARNGREAQDYPVELGFLEGAGET